MKLLKKNTLYMFVCLLLIDLIFYVIAFDRIQAMAIVRMILLHGGVSLLLGFLFDKLSDRKRTVFSFLIVLFVSIYAFVELEFKNFIETYYSLQALADGGFRVQVFVVYFVKMAKAIYYLTFLPSVLYLVLALVFKPEKREWSVKERILRPLLGAVSLGLLVISFLFGETALTEAVRNQDNFDTIIAHTGIGTFFFEDVASLFVKREDAGLVLESGDFVSTVGEKINHREEEVEEERYEASLFRNIDDSRWLKEMEAESNETIKTIDSYLMNRTIEKRNDMTGRYEGYNMIYIMVESLDYMGIDEVLTPTIWKMLTEGYYFDKHYTPVFSCGTGDSEFAGMTSMMPYGSSCTVYSATQNDLHNSLAGIFSRAGYPTHSFHNWDDTFYNRTELHESYGMDEYYDIDDLDFHIVYGWQSDAIMAEKTMSYYIDEEPFFVFYVTSTMHWPYDEDSYYGNAYLDEINAVHPDYPLALKRYISKTMEFDKMLETLVKGLEEAGKLETTVFSFWPDHHPFNISSDIIRKYTSIVDRYEDYGFFLSPFVLYCAGDEGERLHNVCSTFDQLPTIANLFGFDYDPRLYVGSDIFNDDCTVIFANGDWITNDGIHLNYSGEFIPKGEETITDKEIEKKDAYVKNLVRVGRAMVSSDYFANREFLLTPVYRESE